MCIRDRTKVMGIAKEKNEVNVIIEDQKSEKYNRLENCTWKDSVIGVRNLLVTLGTDVKLRRDLQSIMWNTAM